MNYKITYSNELYHFGIKGMKWGVRRYRNEDGSLTPAGKKRYEKNLKYRDKRSEQLISNYNYRSKEAKNAKKHAENIKKYGYKSDEFKEYLKKKEDAAVNKYIKEHTKTGLDEYGFETKTIPSDSRIAAKRREIYTENWLSTLFGEYNSDLKYLQKEYQDSYNRNKDLANKYLKQNKALMDMQVTELTRRKDFRKVAGSALTDFFD